jgi:hypothetical protein
MALAQSDIGFMRSGDWHGRESDDRGASHRFRGLAVYEIHA